MWNKISGRSQGKKDDEKPKGSSSTSHNDARKDESLRDKKDDQLPRRSKAGATEQTHSAQQLAHGGKAQPATQTTAQTTAQTQQPSRIIHNTYSGRDPRAEQSSQHVNSSPISQSLPAHRKPTTTTSVAEVYDPYQPKYYNPDSQYFQQPSDYYDRTGRPTQAQPSPVSTNKSRRSSMSQSTDFRHSPAPSQGSSELLQSSSRNETRQNSEGQVSETQYDEGSKKTQYRHSPDILYSGPAQRSVESVRNRARNENRSKVDTRKLSTEFWESPRLQAVRAELSLRRDSPDDWTDLSTHEDASQDQGLADFGPIRSSSRNKNRQNRSKSLSTQYRQGSSGDLNNSLTQSNTNPQSQQKSQKAQAVTQSELVKESLHSQSATSLPYTQQQQSHRSIQQPPESEHSEDVQQPQATDHSPKIPQSMVSQTSQPVQSQASKQVRPDQQPQQAEPSLPAIAKPNQSSAGQQQRSQPVAAQDQRDANGIHESLAQALQELEKRTRMLEQAEEEQTNLKRELEIAKEDAASKEQALTQKSFELDEAIKHNATIKRQKDAYKDFCTIKHGGPRVWGELEKAKSDLAELQAETATKQESVKSEYEERQESMKLQYEESQQKMKIQHEEQQEKMKKMCDQKLKEQYAWFNKQHEKILKEIEAENEEEVEELKGEISQLESNIERLHTDFTKRLDERDRALEAERKEHDHKFGLTLDDHAAAMTVLKENHWKELQKRNGATAKLKEACSTLESRQIEDTVKIKDLESRLIESLQARIAVVDDREKYFDGVVRSLNMALAQLQEGKPKIGSDEKQRLIAEMSSLTKDSNRPLEDRVDQKVELKESIKRDSGQPSPEVDGQRPILERQTG